MVDKTPSPTSSAGGDSGKGSLAAGSLATSVMNEELRRKLCQLETEIERFKSENAALERLRKEKEEVSYTLYVCTSCICVYKCDIYRCIYHRIPRFLAQVPAKVVSSHV